MSKMTWFKLHSEFRNDPKIKRLPITERYAFIILLCLASESETRGIITGLDDDDIAFELEMQVEDWATLKAKFKVKGFIDFTQNQILIQHWDKRQYDKPSDHPEAVKERKRLQREREKLLKEQEESTMSRDVTPMSRARKEEIRSEEIRSEEIREEENTRSENIYTAPPENFLDSDLPANQVLIDCMADQKENPIPPTPLSLVAPESVGLAIAENIKPQKAQKQQCDLNLFLQVWNQDAPSHWVRHTTIDSATARKLTKFANEFENSLEMFQKGLWFAQTDTQWCMKLTTKLKMTNVLSRDSNLIFQFYQSYEDNLRRSQQSPLDRPMTPVENKMAHTYSMILEAIA